MSANIKPGTLFADRYRILEYLGRGGMGTVYSAQHCALERKYAIKLLHEDLCVNNNALTRFAQEARSASGIEHQNIIDVLDAGRAGDDAFYVMEYLKGEDLQTLFTREAPLPWERVQRISLQICDAMQAAHDRRIIHRDLKPSKQRELKNYEECIALGKDSRAPRVIKLVNSCRAAAVGLMPMGEGKGDAS